MSSPYTGEDAFVYISYVREDHSLVVDEIDRLADLGIRSYWDTGDDTDEDRLKASKFFIAMVSDGAEDSEALLRETGLALRESKDCACFHLADVPLGGKAELLLKGVTDVKKYRMSEALYMRWLANSLPDEVKTREIPIPKEEPSASASAPRPRGGGGVDGPPLMERLKEVDPKIWAIVGGFSAICLLILLVMAISSSSSKTSETAEKTDAKTAADDAATEDPAARAAREKREAERKKQAEETQRREEAKWALGQHLRRGQDKFTDEDWDGAIKALTKGIEQPDLASDPKLAADLAKAYLLRARSYAKLKKREEAVADFQEFTKRKQDDGDAWYELAGLLKTLKRFKEAAAAYGEVVKLQPKRAIGWRYRGDCHRRLKMWKEALEDYTKNIEVDPKDAAAYRYRARVKRKLGDEQGASDDMAKSSEIINNRRRGN